MDRNDRRSYPVEAVDNIEQPEMTADDVRNEQQKLARRKGLTVRELYERFDVGEYRGTILESKLSMLRFMLGEEAFAPAAEE
jgi:hypothetical protein